MAIVFLDFLRAVASGDENRVARRLAAEPALAREVLATGASRQNPATFFLPEIAHYVYRGDTALHVAAAACRRSIVAALIAAGADCRARNRRGAEPLHYAADGNAFESADQAAVIAALVAAGADPNAIDRSGVAPLHRAVRTRSSAAVRALVQAGADPARPNGSGSTPMQLAIHNTGKSGSGSARAKREQTAIIQFLESRGVRRASATSKRRPAT